ncbi:MAG: L-dopachrome tautomerase-related protein [Bacteroidota bacterium]
MKVLSFVLLLFYLIACNQPKEAKTEPSTEENKQEEVSTPTLEVVAELDINPGNVAVSNQGRVFMSVHPLREPSMQLVEVLGDNQYKPFPNASYQSEKDNKTEETFDAPLGVLVDKKDRLWVIDAGLNIGKSRLFAFSVVTGEELYRFTIPEDLAPATSFVQDVAIDDINEWAYLADFGNPGIIAIDIANGTFRKFSDSTMVAEDIDMVIDGKQQFFQGSPARVGINPITLSDDRATLFYGAMSGTKWYQIPSNLFRENGSDEDLKASITVAGPKPICDGVDTDALGNHYFTNIQNNSIDMLDGAGNLTTLVKDPKLDWPDNIRVGPDGWLYVAINQLHKTPAFTGGDDTSTLPFYIVRVKAPTQ